MTISRQTPVGTPRELVGRFERPVVRGDELRTEGAYRFEHAETSPPHTHRYGHLVHPASGVLSLLTADGAWIAPANRFAWVPGGFEHRHRAHGRTDMRIVYLRDRLARMLPDRPAVLVASPLARQAALAVTSPDRRPDARSTTCVA